MSLPDHIVEHAILDTPRVVRDASGAIVGLESNGTTVPLSGGGSSPVTTVVARRFVMQTPSLVWTIPHNMGTFRIHATLRDNDGNQFFAPVKIVSENVFEVRLSSAISGVVDAVFDTQNLPEIQAVSGA